MEEENSIPWDGGGLARSKKKVRRRMTQESDYSALPEHALIEKDEQAVAELQAAYRILQSLLGIRHISPFNEEPTADKFGMSSYFSVIKKPMWLNEVRRKIESGEYDGLHDFVKDVHLVLYNCYKFWGSTHRISSRGYILEHKLERKLQELPWDIKEKMKCPVVSDECVICSIPEDKKMQADELDEIQEDVNAAHYSSTGARLNPGGHLVGYTSKILVKLMGEDNEEVEPVEDEETEEALQMRLKMESWEQEVLNEIEGASSIPHIPELADIGVFLKATHEVLNVEEITQYEVERMLLIPLESSTLQTLMTSIFSPEMKRMALDETPLMPYQVWNNHLRKRISMWCSIFHANCDVIETYEETGINPYFWSVVHLVNPMEDHQNFHDLPFYIRIWILKSLLDNLAHRQKSISEVYSEDRVDPDNIRHLYLGKGRLNHHYKAVPCFLPEIRVYREVSVLTSVWNSDWKGIAEEGVIQLQRNRMSYDNDTLQFGPNVKTFKLVAYDNDSLSELVEETSSVGLEELQEGLSNYKRLLDQSPQHIRCEGLKSIYKQYHDHKSRTSEYFANLENLWLQFQPVRPVRERVGRVSDATEESSQLLGKRRSVPNRLYNEWSDTHSESSVEQDEPSESDVSDWETSFKSHPRHKKLKPANKSKKQSEITTVPSTSQTTVENEIPDSTGEDLLKAITVKNEPAQLSQFKMEPEDEPPVENGLDKRSPPVVVKAEYAADSTTLDTPKTEDVVVIIDSDEEDVKPVISKIKLRDMSTLLETSPPLTATPPMTTEPLQATPGISSPSSSSNPMLNSMLQNTLNVVIPMNAINPATNTPMSINIAPGMRMPSASQLGSLGVQVPPNLYQRPRGPPTMTPIRQRPPGPSRPPMMGRGAVRGAMRGMRGPTMNMNMRGPTRPPGPRQMTVPKPITPKKPVPRPMMMSPQEWAKTPSPGNSPGAQTGPRRGVSPRGRPTAAVQQTWAGRGGTNRGGTVRPSIQPKTLFQEPPKAEGKVTMGLNELGNGYCYQIVLDDGGIRFLTDAEVNAIKRKHSGTLPRRIAIPPDGSFL